MSEVSGNSFETPRVTVVLTSCNRFDLLERTLASFAAFNDFPIHRFLLIEDSGLEAVREITQKFPELKIEVVLNSPSLGQYPAIDKAYSMVDTEFVFHCEDDWEFSRAGIIRDSIVLMEADPSIAMVLPRGDESGPRWIMKKPRENFSGILIRPIDPKAHHTWGNFTFNPGLRRLSHYKLMLGGYTKMGEAATSRFLKRRGYRSVILADGGVRHIGGDGRSTGGANASLGGLRRKRSISSRLRRIAISARLRFSHLLWNLSLLLNRSK